METTKKEIIELTDQQRSELDFPKIGSRSSRSCGCGNYCCHWVSGLLISECDGRILEIRA